MRVLFLTLYPDCAASPRYRVAQFLPYLRTAGVACTVASALNEDEYTRLTGPSRRVRPFWYHARETPRRVRQLLGASRYEVVFLQKAIMTAYLRGMDRVLRGRARRLVYDIDDAVHLEPPHPLRGIWRALEDRDQVRKVMAMSDCVMAGNSWLGSVAGLAGAPVTVFPTVVDTDRFVPAQEPPNAFRIGWIGNPSTTPHLREAGPLNSLPDAAITLVGADPARAPWPEAAVEPWSLDTEVDSIQQFSVGIMPLPKDEWTRGKCALKALQYMACGVPCVATPFGAALDLIEDGVDGLFADSPESWREAVERLRDPILRRRMGEAARAKVEATHSLRNAAPTLLHTLEALA